MTPPDIIRTLSAGGDAKAKRDYWNEMVAQVIDPLHFRTRDWESFAASMETRALGGGAVTKIESDPWQVSVTNEMLSRRRGDRIIVQVCLAGELTFDYEGTSATVSTGQMSIADSQRAHRLRCDTPSKVLCLTLDRSQLGGALKAVEGRAVVMSRNDPIASVTMDLIKTTWKSLPRLTASRRATLEPQIGRMVAESLVRHSPLHDASSSHVQAMIYRAKMIVMHRLGELEFGAHELAEAMGVTRRYLSALFASIDDSPAHYIRRLRLHTAWDMLTDGGCALSIAEIGTRVGFANSSHFSKTIRAAFSLTPVEVRRLKLE